MGTLRWFAFLALGCALAFAMCPEEVAGTATFTQDFDRDPIQGWESASGAQVQAASQSEPGSEVRQVEPRAAGRYLEMPSANLVVADSVPLTTLERIADAQAYDVWGEDVGRGRCFPLCDSKGDVVIYVFPYSIGSRRCPSHQEIFDAVRRAATVSQREGDGQAVGSGLVSQLRSRAAAEAGRFGAVYVSATRRDFPVLRTSHYLHPYFGVGEFAREEAGRRLCLKEPKLERIYFLGLHEEYFEFAANGKQVLVNIDSLNAKTRQEVLDGAAPVSAMTPYHLRQLRGAWRQATELQPTGIDAREVAETHTDKVIPHWKMIPVIDWTWSCLPTAYSMTVGFWDNNVKGAGTVLGYGRLIEHWFNEPNPNPKFHGNNVPSFMDRHWDRKTGWFRAGWKDFADFIARDFGYMWSVAEVHPSPANDSAWKALTDEVDKGRPVLWVSKYHAMTGFGYRVNKNGKFVIAYNTWGKTAQQQRDEWTQAWCHGVTRMIPWSGTGIEHLIIDSPDGGETFQIPGPCKIKWFVWGKQTKRTNLSFSADGGVTWKPIASDVPTREGWNSYLWLPDQSTAKARVKVKGCRLPAGVNYVAGDGSQHNFKIEMSHITWGKWVSMGNPLAGTGASVTRIEDLVPTQQHDGRLKVLVCAVDGSVWGRSEQSAGGAWSSWTSLGAPPGGLKLTRIAVGHNQDGRLQLLAIADDGTLWERPQKQPNGPWANWAAVGKTPAGAGLLRMAVARNQNGRLVVLALSKNHVLWRKTQQSAGGPWAAWQSMGKPPDGTHPGTLAVGQYRDGRLQVFLSGGIPGKGEFAITKGSLWRMRQTKPNGPWSNWISMGQPAGYPTGDIAVGLQKDGRMELFAVGTGAALWHRYEQKLNGPWTGWSVLMQLGKSFFGGVTPLTPVAVGKNQDGRLEVFGLAMAGMGTWAVVAPWHIWQTAPNDGWSSWRALGFLQGKGKSLERIAVVMNQKGRLVAFGNASEDNALWRISQN